MRSFSQRFKGAMFLDASVYEEVEADHGALGQAMVVVLITSVASGFGLGIRQGMGGLIGLTIASLLGWFVWAAVTYVVGTKILPTAATSSDIPELMRTTGFAAAPGVLRIFAVIPILGWVISFAVGVWMLMAMVVAVRQALDYTSTWRAVAVCLTGWLFYVIVGFLLVPRIGMSL